jgi:DNA-binding transcriptional regulator YiaG
MAGVSKRTVEQRFWEKVDRSGGECWEWTGSLRYGYGQLMTCKQGKQRLLLAHRLSYLWHKGDPGELCVMHICDNRKCVNPEHLMLGTRADNQRDMARKGRAPRGERGAHARLRTDQVLEIRRQRLNGVEQNELAARFGVSQPTISDVEHRRTWAHV